MDRNWLLSDALCHICSPITPDRYLVKSCFSLPYTSVYPRIFDALEWMEMQNGLPLSGLLELCYQTNYFTQRLKTWNLIQIYPFLIPLPLQCMNLQKYLSLNIHQADLASPDHQPFFLFYGLSHLQMVLMTLWHWWVDIWLRKGGCFGWKKILESMLDGSGFGAATEMGGFALDKGP